MLLIVLLMLSIATLAVPPCLIANIRVSSNFGASRERFYEDRMLLPTLKTFRRKIKRGYKMLHILGSGFSAN
jgi:hypothetical protein